MADRRTFLRGLASLPLIGGSVALIGSPTAAAVPTTDTLLHAYDEWLDLERSWLLWERYGKTYRDEDRGAPIGVAWFDKATGKTWTCRHATNLSGFDHTDAASRAAVVMAAAGVDLTKGRRL